ncbi:MAG: ubiquinone/menaquinone biosynthesis methyltransferase [Chloroflexi bacterium]|nr:ubiquinone/menaquinone biosynthesis methyltransferase [Chloroflexota bacterium]
MAHLRGDDKRQYVAEMFARISPRYDLMNSLMTGGLHHRWKRETARFTAAGLHGAALDVATGTGDLAFALARCPGIDRAVGVDLLSEMLTIAADKPAASDKTAASTSFAMGDALQLPFPDSTFVCATAGFSLRNMADVPAAIAEMARVVSPGGRVTTLELTPMPPGIRAALGRLYFHRFVPLMGQLVAGDRTAYTYLPSSVDYFLTAEGLADVYRQAGLVNVGYRRLGMGGVALHYGEKPG